MTLTADMPDWSTADHPLKSAFLKWQCHARQIIMRTRDGRPDAAITPAVHLPGQDDPMGHIITLINKTPAYSVTPELSHMARKTNDPAQRRKAALQFLSATYYQKHKEFSELLTATFAPGSAGASTLVSARACCLNFEAYAQRFSLQCEVTELVRDDPLFRATIAHNRLFNPDLPSDTKILAFRPDWQKSMSDPDLGNRC